MFAKPRDNGRRNVGRNRTGGNSARPGSLPGFLRSDPNSELAASYRRLQTASLKHKQSAKPKTCYEKQKRLPPVTNEYEHIRSPVGDYIRRPFIDSYSETISPAPPPVPEKRYISIQNASTFIDEDKQEANQLLEDLDNEGIWRRALSRADLEYLFAKGIAEVQCCKTTPAVFKTYAKAFHDILEYVAYVPCTADVSTQTCPPKLQRTQLNLIYAGFWERCTSRQNLGMQTEDQNLTFAKHRPTKMLLENSKTNLSWKLFGWKSVGLTFLISSLVLGLMEIPNFF